MPMSMVSLDPNVKKKIETELGASIPSPDEEAFEGFVESLRLSHGELHRELILSLRVDTKMPAEQEAIKAARRSRLKGYVDKSFYKTRWPNDRVLDKKRLVLSTLGLLMVFLPSFYLLGRKGLEGTAVTDLQVGEAAIVDNENLGNGPLGQYSFRQPLFVPEITTELANDNQELASTLPSETPRQIEVPLPPEKPTSSASSQDFVPFPQTVVSSSSSPEPAPITPLAPEAVTRANTSDPNWLTTIEDLPKHLVVADQTEQVSRLEVWKSAASLSQPPLGLALNGASAIRSVNQFSNASDEKKPLAIETSQVDTSETLSIPISTGRPNDSKGHLALFSVDLSGEQPISISIPALTSQPLTITEDLAENSDPLTLFKASVSPQVINDQKTNQPTEAEVAGHFSIPSEALEPEATFLQLGALIPARLMVGVVMDKNTEMPVIADSAEGWCGQSDCPQLTWVGTAKLSANDRIEMSFTEVVMANKVYALSAFALGRDNSIGIATNTEVVGAEVAQTVLQSAAGGVSDYLEALINQQKITLKNNTVVQEDDVPGVEAFLLNRFAGLLSVPSLSEESTKVATLPQGTEFTIFVGANH